MVAYASERVDTSVEPASVQQLGGGRTAGDVIAIGWHGFVAGWSALIRGCELAVLFLETLGAFAIGAVLMTAKFAMGIFGLGLSVWLVLTAPVYFDGWIALVLACAPLIVALFCIYRIYSAVFVEHLPPKWIRQRAATVLASGIRKIFVFVKPAAVWLTAKAVRHTVLLAYRGRRMMAGVRSDAA